MSQEINNFNVDILEKGADWNVSETDIPALIVNGSEIPFFTSDSSEGHIYLGYSGSVPIEGSGSKFLEIWIGVGTASLDEPWVDSIEEFSPYDLDIQIDSTASMGVGSTRSLSVTRYINGEVSQEGTLAYESDNTRLLTVDSNGVITCVGNFSSECAIHVSWFMSGSQDPICKGGITVAIEYQQEI